MEEFNKKVSPFKKNHKNTKKFFSNCPMWIQGSLKGLEIHLLSWDARRGPPGRRETRGRRGVGLFRAIAGVIRRNRRNWPQNHRALVQAM